MTISNESRSRIKGIFEPIALAMGRLGLTPNSLTLIGFAITTVGAILVGLQAWIVGGVVVFFGGVFDMFDGTLARATGQANALGAFMDSVFDKMGEIIVFLGVIAGMQAAGAADVPILVAAAAMGASIMVSYARARAEAAGTDAEVGLFARPERVILIALALLIQRPILAAGILAILTNVTTLQRIVHVWRTTRSSEPR